MATVTEKTKRESKWYSRFCAIVNLIGAGAYLLLLGIAIEGLALIVQQWIAFPISLSFELQIYLTIPCVVVCLLGALWFNRSLNLVRVHLLHGEHTLITDGPFAYVRHPLYTTLLITIPPLVIVWLSDLIFLLPWALILVFSHYVVRIEERALIAGFGAEYKAYRRYVPALIPYKGAGGKRYREARGDAKSPPSD